MRVQRDAALQAPAVSWDPQFEAVHNRASVGRVIALPLGLVVYGFGLLYDVFGWVFLGTLVFFALTIITPGILKLVRLPSRLAKSELMQLIVNGLILLALWFVLRGSIHLHFTGWGSFFH
ncbi:MAG TPA: hypothetical protein VFH00_05335 [Candidatus Nitrosotalea sp.]|nr:hypothetical protein [Candidatus Nitrosotalea sp.]